MLFTRQFLAVAATSSLIVGALATSVQEARAQSSASCEDAAGVAVLASPIAPWKGAPLRVVFTTEEPIEGELSLVAPNGKPVAATPERHGGPPYFWFAEVAKPTQGKWTAVLKKSAGGGDCAELKHEISVGSRPGPPGNTRKSVWPIRASWNRQTENMYSAWIEKMFDAPLEESLSWKALHEVLRDEKRNVLFNYLSLREDEQKQTIRPDCADLPYFLRAYFAFKMGLPFGYSQCTRGSGGNAPQCVQWWNVEKEQPPPAPPAPKAQPGVFGLFGPPPAATPVRRVPTRPQSLVPGFGFYISRTIADGVHSGNGRTALDDNRTDYYPVPLKQETLRPGTVYADPYGHLLVLVKRVSQTAEGAGVFLAVDGQPDGTVARKRFWRGNFLFAQDPALGGPGFKHFRPIVRSNGTLRRMTNEEIANSPEYANFSTEQSKMSIEDFYDRMDDVMSPQPLDPVRAMKEAVTSLEEQVNARVTSVENGRKYQGKSRGEVAIPDGASIFETSGPWEDYATPARDLRLLIAIDVVDKFPERVARRPDRYAMPAGKTPEDVKAELQQVLKQELAARKFSYMRTDGSEWTLSLQDVIDRMKLLEMAYNINDCVEHRWGAPEGSKEAATCRQRASAAQQSKMSEYREWFQDRRRPPRG